ncbi:MAG: Rrf2 family transcriptional regulator [Bacteroidia bacterium]|nr:Rrf2 family transcriptional regulator [Bacteroidia bacterium]NND10957.1 Rrf2 family transcriptional regulator [Flavobacteriaceae bacterium]NNK27398.1 Rrf2 family transcriptional regulator [Flavobacteriaceae bacterium]
MLSKSTKYALKAVLFLAVNSSENSKVMVKDIAKPINVPQAYIAKLLQKLSKENIISSSRGPKGGFYLSEGDRQHSVLSIIIAIEGEKKLTNCLLNLKKCNEFKPCPLHNKISSIRSELLQSFGEMKIDELSQEIKAAQAFLPL